MKTHHSIKNIVALLGSLALVATPSEAKPGGGNSGNKGQGKGGNAHSQKADKSKAPDHTGKGAGQGDRNDKDSKKQFARFQDNERNEILDYFGRFRTQGEGLPPGLAMNQRRGKPLPPGWQKKLVPGYRIGDSEWSSYAPVPSSWFPNQRMEPNTRLYHYGDRVVRVYEPRREVVDVISLLR